MRMRWTVAGIVLAVVAFSAAGSAVELLQVGVRIDLGLHPLKVGGAARWDFAVGGYGLVHLNEGWGARASVGYSVANAGPYASLGVARAVVENVLLEGDVTFQWNFRDRSSTANLDAGVRFRSRPESQQRSSLAIFPASWTLNTASGRPALFSFSPSFTAEAALVLDVGLLAGAAITVGFLRVPTGDDQPVWPIGDGWMLSTRLTPHIAYVPAHP